MFTTILKNIKFYTETGIKGPVSAKEHPWILIRKMCNNVYGGGIITNTVDPQPTQRKESLLLSPPSAVHKIDAAAKKMLDL